MARAYSHDAHGNPDPHRPNAGDDSHRPARTRAITTTSARPQAMPAQGRAATAADAQLHVQPLDLKALRLAVHGWWLGNPLVYKPGVADLLAVSRELARAGAASGTCILSDVPAGSNLHAGGVTTKAGTILDAEAMPFDTIHAVLVVRPVMPTLQTSLGSAAAQAVAEVAQAALGRTCAVRRRWQVVLRNGGRIASCLCHISVAQDEDVALVDIRLALDWLRQVAQDDDGQESGALFARSDWREVFLARVLHVLDGRLRTVCVA